MLKVSIVIPIYNDEQYIEECLISVMNQTYKNLEIICVNDCSKDNSAIVLQKMTSKDSRIKVINCEKNVGAYMARKYGVCASTGDYLMFVDADDTLDSELLDELVKTLSVEDVDILQFSSTIINCGLDDTIIDDMRNFTSPLCEKLYKSDILEKCFCDNKYGYNIWNKIYKADLCKNVFFQLPDLEIKKANDVFIYFFVAANATSYIGIESQNKYNYFYGRGNTGECAITAKEYLKYCRYSEMLCEMQKALDVCPNAVVAKAALEKLKGRLLVESLSVWIFSVKSDEKGKALEVLLGSWDILEILDRYITLFYDQTNHLAEYIYSCSHMKAKNVEKGKVAIYFCQDAKAGIKEILFKMISLLLQAGYELIFIGNEITFEDNCDLLNAVKQYSITDIHDVCKGKIMYIDRARKMLSILSEEKIDTVCWIGAVDDFALYDTIAIKSMGIRVAMIRQELFPQNVISCPKPIAFQKNIFRLVDVLLVFSKEEKVFWMTFGIDSLNVEDLLESTRTIDIGDTSELKKCIDNGNIDNFIKGLLFEQKQSVVAYKKQSVYEDVLETLLLNYSEKSKAYNELSRKYEVLKEKYKVEQIRKISKENELKLAIYPYGVQGKRIEQLLHSNDINTDLIIDNDLSAKNCEIFSTDDLAKINVSDFLFIICSNNEKFYEDIRQTIYHIAPQENIFDWYSLDEEI